MRTQDIKNMATAMQQVAENQKAALAKKLARAGASSEKGKAAVTLPKAPWDKKEAVDEAKPIKLRGFGPDHKKASGSSLKKIAGMKEGMSSKEKMKKGLYNSKMDPVGQADADIDNDGDVDKSDKYLKNRRKAISKNVNSGDKSEVEMNPKMKKDKKTPAAGDTMEGTVYARILENRAQHYKKAAAPETMDDKLKGKGAKDMADDMTLKTADKISNYDELGHDDAAKAGRSGPSKKNRRNDNDKGDKKAIPSATPTKGT